MAFRPRIQCGKATFYPPTATKTECGTLAVFFSNRLPNFHTSVVRLALTHIPVKYALKDWAKHIGTL